jgi:hypothetical protein
MSTYKVKGILDACILYSGSGVIATTNIPFGNTFTLAPEYDTITYEGDGSTEEEYVNLRLTGTIGGDKLDTDVLARMTGKTAVTSGSGIDGVESSRFYMGAAEDLTPPQVGLRVDLSAVDDTLETAKTVRLTVFKAKIKPVTPPDGSNNEKWGPVMFEWSAERTSVDIIDAALPGVPTGGAMYAISILS